MGYMAVIRELHQKINLVRPTNKGLHRTKLQKVILVRQKLGCTKQIKMLFGNTIMSATFIGRQTDLPTVQRISGHKTLQMVVRYSHQNGEHIKSAMDLLEKRYASTIEAV